MKASHSALVLVIGSGCAFNPAASSRGEDGASSLDGSGRDGTTPSGLDARGSDGEQPDGGGTGGGDGSSSSGGDGSSSSGGDGSTGQGDSAAPDSASADAIPLDSGIIPVALPYLPSNIPDVTAIPPSGAMLDLGSSCTFDAEHFMLVSGSTVACAGLNALGHAIVTQPSGGSAAVLSAQSMTIEPNGALVLTGGLPIIFVVGHATTINGLVSVGANGPNGGPGAQDDNACSMLGLRGGVGKTASVAIMQLGVNLCGGGSGGGGFGTIGEAGGDGAASGAKHGNASGALMNTATLIPLRGGCSGSDGARGEGSLFGGRAAGGGGGGGLQISTGAALTVGGGIVAPGGGGRGALVASGGGGGGSGGGILLEASTMVFATGGRLLAGGGGGGEGGDDVPSFRVGHDGRGGSTSSTQQAAGGTGGTIMGGNGGAGAAQMMAAHGDNGGGAAAGGGGGGGGDGIVYINSMGSCTVAAGVLAAPKPGQPATNHCPFP